MNMITFTVTFCCILFCFFLSIVYFTRENNSNIENKLYKNLVILDFVILIFSMACLIIGNYLKYNTKLLTLYDVSATTLVHNIIAIYNYNN